MTKDAITKINDKISGVVEAAIHIINEKLERVTKTIGVAAKKQAGALCFSWWCSLYQLAEGVLQQVFNGVSAPRSSKKYKGLTLP